MKEKLLRRARKALHWLDAKLESMVPEVEPPAVLGGDIFINGGDGGTGVINFGAIQRDYNGDPDTGFYRVPPREPGETRTYSQDFFCNPGWDSLVIIHDDDGWRWQYEGQDYWAKEDIWVNTGSIIHYNPMQPLEERVRKVTPMAEPCR